jgi:hypothetical protein
MFSMGTMAKILKFDEMIMNITFVADFTLLFNKLQHWSVAHEVSGTFGINIKGDIR